METGAKLHVVAMSIGAVLALSMRQVHVNKGLGNRGVV